MALQETDRPAEYLTPEQVEHDYQIPPKTLETWRYRRTGPRYVKVGALIRYRRSDLEAWLASRTVTPDSKQSPPTGPAARARVRRPRHDERDDDASGDEPAA